MCLPLAFGAGAGRVRRLTADPYTGQVIATARGRIQSRLPGALIRRIVVLLVIAIGTRYLWSGLS
jgi:hypothetical protein